MPALILVIGNTAVAAAAFLLIFLFLFARGASMSPEQRMIRERRRHAERTAKTMARMSKVRALTMPAHGRGRKEVAAMSEYAHQLRAVCRWNRQLARANSLLQIKLRATEQKLRQIEGENANLAIELDAVNTALGAAMDEALKARCGDDQANHNSGSRGSGAGGARRCRPQDRADHQCAGAAGARCRDSRRRFASGVVLHAVSSSHLCRVPAKRESIPLETGIPNKDRTRRRGRY